MKRSIPAVCRFCGRDTLITARQHGNRQHYCRECLSEKAKHYPSRSNNAAHVSAYKKAHPERTKARHAVRRAIKRGTLVRQPCEVCGDTNVHGHHDDYSRPLSVRWLCHIHHVEHHQGVKS